ncbi:response regulator [Halomonas binhaiensis]|uniref:Response regulator n=1 Tax=Halomonas binhaiensis TaxID=2562282 RepID=A0A5C1NF35_9GAMM|nr:response regulator [Halomonas binhaiensis]QEM80875.1 response regulator [Halomonas binhaiensis]
MSANACRDRLWRRLVIPILWPVGVAQLVLLALVLVLGGSLRWLMPDTASWSTTLWLVLGLLCGSTLNVAVFLMLLKHRLRRVQRDDDSLLVRVATQLEQRLEQAGMEAPGGEEQLSAKRVQQLLDAVESLSLSAEAKPAPPVEGALSPGEELLKLGKENDRLASALVRARDESRLKSGYLAHVSKSLSAIIEMLENRTLIEGRGAGDERATPAGSKASDTRAMDTRAMDTGAMNTRSRDDSADVEREALYRRLSEILLLVENLDDREPGKAGFRVAGPRVLIVDDGPVNLMLARQVLEREGFDVLTATSGQQALDQLEAHSVDLILMDIVLPDIDGVEICRRLRAMEAATPQRERAVVIALTANVSELDQTRFRQAGMDDFLAKPYKPQELLETLDTWLPDSGPQPGEH